VIVAIVVGERLTLSGFAGAALILLGIAGVSGLVRRPASRG
jgi:drug/metabolite transporter (DMT)-like permease